MVADLLWSIFVCFVCANSLESLKKKPLNFFRFFFEDVSRRFCFQGVIKKVWVIQVISQQVKQLWDIALPHHQVSHWGHLRQGVNGGCNTGEGITGLHCRWLIATVASHHLCSVMVAKSRCRFPPLPLFQTICFLYSKSEHKGVFFLL